MPETPARIPWADRDDRNHSPEPHRCECSCHEDVDRSCPEHAFEVLRRREIITTDPAEQAECCGLPRDEDGFCIHRPGHPIAVSP